MRPLCAKALDLARVGCSYLFRIFRNRHIVMTDVTITDFIDLMTPVIEGNTVPELDNV